VNEFAARYLVMPTFGEPLVLVALVLPALMLVWAWTRRFVLPSRRVVLPLDGARVGSGWGWWVLITLGECLPALLLAMGIILLANPQINGPPREKRLLTNIQICVDVSGSMTAQYGEGRRYDAAMKAVEKFVDYRKGDAFGLTFFGDAYVHWVPLTSDASAIKCATPFMDPEIAPPAFGGTAIANALRGCKKELVNREEGERMILLITDGISFDLQEAESEIAKEMVDSKITVFAVIAAQFDPQPELMTICRTSGGEAFRADDPDALFAVFKKIDGMKKAKFTSTFVERVDHFTPFAALGLVFLSLASFYGLGLRYTPW
jgi:Ca-activated chloride channel homolog